MLDDVATAVTAADPDRAGRPYPLAASRMAEFAALVRSARDERSPARLAALWKETFALAAWFFLVDPALLPRSVRPRIVERAGRRGVLVFTDELAALHSATRAMRCVDGEAHAELATLEVPRERVLALCEALAREGASFALFNDGPASFEAPLTALASLAAAVDGAGATIDASLFDPCLLGGDTDRQRDVGASLARAQGGTPEARTMAILALLSMETWWFICNPREPESVYVRRFDGLPAVVAFTDERLALDACRRFGLAGDAGEMLLLQLAGSDAVEWLDGFRAHDVDRIVFDPLSTPFHVDFDTLREARRDPPPA